MEYVIAVFVLMAGLWAAAKFAGTVVGFLPASLTGNATFGSYVTLAVQAGVVLGVILIARKALPGHFVKEV